MSVDKKDDGGVEAANDLGSPVLSRDAVGATLSGADSPNTIPPAFDLAAMEAEANAFLGGRPETLSDDAKDDFVTTYRALGTMHDSCLTLPASGRILLSAEARELLEPEFVQALAAHLQAFEAAVWSAVRGIQDNGISHFIQGNTLNEALATQIDAILEVAFAGGMTGPLSRHLTSVCPDYEKGALEARSYSNIRVQLMGLLIANDSDLRLSQFKLSVTLHDKKIDPEWVLPTALSLRKGDQDPAVIQSVQNAADHIIEEKILKRLLAESGSPQAARSHFLNLVTHTLHHRGDSLAQGIWAALHRSKTGKRIVENRPPLVTTAAMMVFMRRILRATRTGLEIKQALRA